MMIKELHISKEQLSKTSLRLGEDSFNKSISDNKVQTLTNAINSI